MLCQISSVYVRLYQVKSCYFRLGQFILLGHFRTGKMILVQVRTRYVRLCQLLTFCDM